MCKRALTHVVFHSNDLQIAVFRLRVALPDLVPPQVEVVLVSVVREDDRVLVEEGDDTVSVTCQPRRQRLNSSLIGKVPFALNDSIVFVTARQRICGKVMFSVAPRQGTMDSLSPTHGTRDNTGPDINLMRICYQNKQYKGASDSKRAGMCSRNNPEIKDQKRNVSGTFEKVRC